MTKPKKQTNRRKGQSALKARLGVNLCIYCKWHSDNWGGHKCTRNACETVDPVTGEIETSELIDCVNDRRKITAFGGFEVGSALRCLPEGQFFERQNG